MTGVNKALLIGRVGRDPEVKYSQSGAPFAIFGVAISSRWKDRETGQPQERTEWVKVIAWNRLAEICGEYVTKGSLVYVEGSIQTSKFESKGGETHYSTKVRADQIKFLGGSRNGGNGAQQGVTTSRSPDEISDDDIPF